MIGIVDQFPQPPSSWLSNVILIILLLVSFYTNSLFLRTPPVKYLVSVYCSLHIIYVMELTKVNVSTQNRDNCPILLSSTHTYIHTESVPPLQGPPQQQETLVSGPPHGVREVTVEQPNVQTSFGFVLQSNTLRLGSTICK